MANKTGRISNAPTTPCHPMFAMRWKVAGLMDKYLLRPPYQQNDYIGWISRAKRAETRQKRLN